MKKKLLATLITCAFTAQIILPAQANEISKSSIVKRALTLKSNEISLGAGIGYSETEDSNSWGIGLAAGYGITDDWTIGIGTIRYRALARQFDEEGLELTFGGGLKGYLQRGSQDVFGYGVDMQGKYVFDDQFAVTFGTEYIFWNDVGTDNPEEYRYSVGILFEPIDDITFSAGYAYRDLKGFVDDNANTVNAGVNYAISKQTDVGITASYSDFDAIDNGFNIDEAHKHGLGVYINYRF